MPNPREPQRQRNFSWIFDRGKKSWSSVAGRSKISMSSPIANIPGVDTVGLSLLCFWNRIREADYHNINGITI